MSNQRALKINVDLEQAPQNKASHQGLHYFAIARVSLKIVETRNTINQTPLK